jgi:hypothetical protein
MTVGRLVGVGILMGAVLVTALIGVFVWALWGGGGPLVWAGVVRPMYIHPAYEQSGSMFCSPMSEEATDRVCLTVSGPWTHDPADAYGGSSAEYARIGQIGDCDELQAYVERNEAEIRAGGPLAGRSPIPEEGYILAAALRQEELSCFE